MSPRRRTKIERMRDRGDSRRLVRILDQHDWLVDRDGMARDLAVGRRVEAVRALGTIDTDHAEEGIVRALDDDDPRVRLAAVMALRPASRDPVTETLARAAATWRGPDFERARTAALNVLVELDDDVLAVVFAQTLVNDLGRDELTADDERDLRRLFGSSDGDETVALADWLVERLATPDEGRRRRAHQALVTLGATAVVPLIGALRDPVRQQPACTALGRIRDTRAVPALIRMLESGDREARVLAARALGDIRDARALEALFHGAGDGDPHVRDAALDALDKLRSLVAGLGVAALAESYEEGADEGHQLPADVRLRLADGHGHEALLRRLLGW